MTINSINGANSQAGQMGMNQATDAYSRNIQNQIANAQKQLQELSSNKDMSLEEKMKKRQEIQQQISDLNMQLRQHQMEQRRAAISGSKKQQAKGSAMDDASSGTRNAERKSTGLSQISMTAILSADSSLEQAKVQGSATTSLEGTARVLKSEIKTSQGASLEKKKEDLADIEQKAQAAASSQVSSLADANKTMEEAAKAESKTEKADNKDANTASANEKDSHENVSGADIQVETVSNTESENTQSENSASKSISAETTAPQQTAYTSVDIRL